MSRQSDGWRSARVKLLRAQGATLATWLDSTGDLLELFHAAGRDDVAARLRPAMAAVRSAANDFSDEITRLELETAEAEPTVERAAD